MCCPDVSELPPPPPGKTGWPWTEGSAEASDIRSSIVSRSLVAVGSEPKVSMVTPSYNQAQFLEETIRSVLLQGYPNLEYIIMDGGSTDGSVEIIQKYAPWLAYWVSEKDGGQADAVNKGWQIATGDAVTWLNSDDVLMSGCLETVVSALYGSEPAELVYGNVYAINADSQVLYLIRGAPFVSADILVRAHNPIPQQGFLLKRSLLERIGWLDPELHFCMDFDYWCRAALHNVQAVYVDTGLAYFRQHACAKTSTQYKIRISNRERIFEKVFSDPHLSPLYQQQRETARNYVLLQAAYIAYKAGDVAVTRRYAWQYICAMRRRSSFLGLYLFFCTLGGHQGLQLAKRLRSLRKGRRQGVQ